jgi:error-prone DNA polymerase
MRAYEDQFVTGAAALHGVGQELAQRVYDQIVGFSGFGFPKSHSAAFGLLAYQSTWLRVHYAPEFLCALMNEQPMGFYPPDTLAHEAQRRGIEVRAPCVRRSTVECAVEDDLGVRVGLGYVSGVRAEEVRALVAERERAGPYASIPDLAARSGMGADGLARLAWAGACDELADGRRQALWQLGVAAPGVPVGKHGTQLALPLDLHDAPELEELGVWDRLLADYGSIGVTLHEHPLELMRPTLPPGCFSSADLDRARDGTRVRVAGLVVARQRPATAKGVTFMLLEDEFGTLNLIVPPPVHDRCRLAVRGEPLIIASGKLEHREGVTNVVVHDVQRLDRGDLPKAEIRHIEPRRTWSSESGEVVPGTPGAQTADLREVAPAANSFGRGRR